MQPIYLIILIQALIILVKNFNMINNWSEQHNPKLNTRANGIITFYLCFHHLLLQV